MTVLAPSVPPPAAISWTPVRRALSPATQDGNPSSYELLRVGQAQDPADFGLEWQAPTRVGTLSADFATLGGRAFEPDARSVRLEVWKTGRWRPVRADIEIDATRSGVLAPLQGRGIVRWTFRFAPVVTERVRIYASAPAHRDLAYQCIALTDLAASPNGVENPTGSVTVRGERQASPRCFEPGTNLVVPEAGATVAPYEAGVRASSAAATRASRMATHRGWSVAWRQPVMVSSVSVRRPARIVSVERETGGRWRHVENMLADGDGGVTFTPVCVTGIRVHTDRPTGGNLTVRMGAECADWFEAVRLSRTDILGDRFRALERADLSDMDSMLQPINFAKTAIGRPADLVETMALWTGTFLQLGSEAFKNPNTGADQQAQTVERWVAPAPAGKAPDWFRTHSRYLEGWMPSVVTAYDDGPVAVAQTLFVTAPDAPVYGTVAIARIANSGPRTITVPFTYAMGRRRVYGDPPTPFVSDPLATGYTLDADRRTVRDPSGNVALHAFQPGIWGGTERERHLTFRVKLKPGEAKNTVIFVPDVTQPLTDPSVVSALRPESLLDGFRRYWTGLMARSAEIVTPEQRLNDAARNLLAQCMIVGLDGDTARYGAYHYESYFGLEEGWTAVALAQFGLPEYARRIMDYMLSPACLDKANYHHQYRNGLAPWYAVDVARLTADREWLARWAQTLRACADWTVTQIQANQDPRWGGILPRHAYGGDIGMPAYSFYANATCWRGLHETAQAMAMLGDQEAAARYSDAAAKYRQRLIELADSLADRSGPLPFLPMSFGLVHDGMARDREPTYQVLAADVPYSDIWSYLGNYWNLFAPCFQELRLFPVGDARSRWVPEYMEERGGILAGQVRFANGLDAVYGKGYIQSLLDHGRRDRFVTSLYGVFSAAMSRTLFSCPEVSGIFPLRTGNLPIWREHERERWFWPYRYGGAWAQGWQNQEGEPLAACAGMALQLLRSALVREDYAEDPPQDLRLLDGAPRHWLEPGSRVVARRMPTFFGEVSVEAVGEPSGATAGLDIAPGFAARRVIVRLASPDGRPIRTVSVNGRPTAPASTDEVILDSPSGKQKITVTW